jgi:hypothetical protein
MLQVNDLCIAYLKGYIQCKVTEYLLHEKVLSSELDIIKEQAVKCMEQYKSFAVIIISYDSSKINQ